MADVVFIALALAFFGLSFLYVLGCDRILRRDTPGTRGAGEPDRGVAATDQTEAAVTS